MDLGLLIFLLLLLAPLFFNIYFFSYNILGIFYKKGTKGFKAIVSVFIFIPYFLLFYLLSEHVASSQSQNMVDGPGTFLSILVFIGMPILNLLNFKNYGIKVRFVLVFSLPYTFAVVAFVLHASYAG